MATLEPPLRSAVLTYSGVTPEELQAACMSLGLTMRAKAAFVQQILNAIPQINNGSNDNVDDAPPPPPILPSSSSPFDPDLYITTHPAVTLRPTSTLSAATLADLYNKQPLWNVLIDAAARHPTFLATILKDTAASDTQFTGKFVTMYKELYDVREETAAEEEEKGESETQHRNEEKPSSNTSSTTNRRYRMQPAMLGIFRNDYMQDDSGSSTNNTAEADGEKSPAINSASVSAAFKQVEINTISCSFAGLSPRVGALHRLVAQHVAHDKSTGNSSDHTSDAISISESQRTVGASLAAALHHYIKVEHPLPSLVPVVCYLVEEKERNTADQFALAFTTEQAGGIRCIRRTLREIHASLKLVDDDDNNDTTSSATDRRAPRAVLDDRYEVGVFYFRTGYNPGDFSKPGQWEARRMVEQTNAIKCPSLPQYLCTYKKVQQVLTGCQYVRSRYLDATSAKNDNTNNSDKAGVTNGGGNVEVDMVRRLLPHVVPVSSSGSIRSLAVPVEPEGGDLLAAAQSHDTPNISALSSAASIKTTSSGDIPFEVPLAAAAAAGSASDSSNQQQFKIRFFDNEQTAATILKQQDDWMSEWIRSNMVPIYSLNSSENIHAESAIHDGIRNPQRYMLKPQLEGGGHLYSGEEMVTLLKTKPPSGQDDTDDTYNRVRQEYILMQRIAVKRIPIDSLRLTATSLVSNEEQQKGKEQDATSATSATFNPDSEISPLFRFGNIIHRSAITRATTTTPNVRPNDDLCSELGIYGVVLTTAPTAVGELSTTSCCCGTQITAKPFDVTAIFNQSAGYVVRSKPAAVDDGGVMAGAAFLDSLALT